jgi:LmbE family N-acetylglucosaminyl deacetylase
MVESLRYAGRRVAGVFAHPDDESYAAGGLLASCARGGATVQVVSLTRGEAGVDRRGEATRGDPLAAVRTSELARACSVLGSEPPRVLDLPDGRLAALPLQTLASRIRRALGDSPPDLVVTLGRDGAYGHGDHLACTRAVTLAVEGLDVRVLHSAFAQGLFEPVWRRLRKLRGVVAVAASDLGTPAEAVALRVELGAHRASKLAAIAAHASQLDGGDPRSFLHHGLIDALLEEEWYTVAAGPPLPPGGSDPFLGLERHARAAPHP